MKPPFKPELRREDMPGAPGWIDGLLNQLNIFIRAVVQGLTNNITFSENILSQIHEGRVRSTDLPVLIKKRFPLKAIGVLKIYAERDTDVHTTVSDAIDFSWRDEGDSVKIYDITNIDTNLWRYGIIILYG